MEQATRFELVSTSKLRRPWVTILQSLLLRADEVIQ
jgi:hypothetical protein